MEIQDTLLLVITYLLVIDLVLFLIVRLTGSEVSSIHPWWWVRRKQKKAMLSYNIFLVTFVILLLIDWKFSMNGWIQLTFVIALLLQCIKICWWEAISIKRLLIHSGMYNKVPKGAKFSTLEIKSLGFNRDQVISISFLTKKHNRLKTIRIVKDINPI